VFRGYVNALAEALLRVLATPETASEDGSECAQRIRTWSFEEMFGRCARPSAQLTHKIVAKLKESQSAMTYTKVSKRDNARKR